jgi:hypothetical protein
MSSPLTIFLAPIALRRFILGSGWRRFVVPGAFALGVGAQAIYRLTHPLDSRYTEVNLNNIPRFLGLRVVASTLVGDGHLKSSWEALGWTLVFITAGVTVVVLAYGLAVGRGRRTFIVASVGTAVLLTVASLLLRGSGDNIVLGSFTLSASRYAFVPVLLLTAAFIAVADAPGGRRWLRVLPAGLVLGAAAANATAADTIRGDGSDWPNAVEAAREACSDPAHVVGIPGTPGGWQSFIECRHLIDP